MPMLIVERPVRSGGHLRRAGVYSRPWHRRIPQGELIHLVLGPWNHGQGRREGRGIGPILFEGDTATWFRRNDHAAVPRPLSEGRTQARYAARARLRDRRGSLASLRRLAALLRRGLSAGGAQSVPAARGQAWLRGAGSDRPAAAGSAAADRSTTNTSPIRPSPCRTAPRGRRWPERQGLDVGRVAGG